MYEYIRGCIGTFVKCHGGRGQLLERPRLDIPARDLLLGGLGGATLVYSNIIDPSPTPPVYLSLSLQNALNVGIGA